METTKIGLLNGPNLNLLGLREPEIYGKVSLSELIIHLKGMATPHIELIDFQSNSEGELIDFIHNSITNNIEYIILNAGALTHTSIALRDAIKATKTKVIEVHISNIYCREEFRRNSLIAPVCIGHISGFGLASYELALHYIQNKALQQNL
ncbi:MAG: type II 3-dehydroquinate dehydratase [Desulfurivibrionaceae bacterium]|nr:type II 3-dehydroquinate dehydratase [Desulfurivibrionaceae bacterium]